MMRAQARRMLVVTGSVVVLAAALGPLGALAGVAQAQGNPARERIAKTVAGVRKLGLPGAVLGVTGGAVGHYDSAFGTARPGHRMTLRSRFRVASISKTFTATVILELVDRHLLKLNDTIARWEPKVPNARRITIEMLLSMRSGIWDEGGSGPDGRESLLGKLLDRLCRPDRPSPNCGRYFSPQQLVDLAIREGPPAYPPGFVYYYSDTNYMIMGIIAQKVTGRSLAWLVQHLILDPLHMRHTTMPTRSLRIPGSATTGYLPLPVDAPTRYVPGPVASPSDLFGSGNIVTTLGDLQIWARALGTGKLLKPDTQRLRLRLTPTAGEYLPLVGSGLHTVLPASYGLGLAGAGGMIGHNGEVSYPGYTSDMWYVPKAGGTVVVLLNSITPCAGGTVVADALAGTLAMQAFSDAELYRASSPGLMGTGCLTL